ncbi:GNAT family N-acetyltransferase [Agarilytica rhodophyticola]|uniref:GNAT family N-acetyltransferase n=1 Tax=Agarilytica rhodophyticola TaxID=1737490 RepID=UPI000B342C18|nr:GNAT family N-acetyltransferase [Agarilytica rhodophyticola]
MDMDKTNLANLTGLWKKYGAQPISNDAVPLQYTNLAWPHRCWFDVGIDNLNHANYSTWLDRVPQSAIIPLWPMIDASIHLQNESLEKQLLEQKWRCTFEQKAMYMELQDADTYSPPIRVGFSVSLVRTCEDLKKWVNIGSEAFAYSIDYSVVENLIDDGDIKIVLGWQGKQAVAAALLYKTYDIIGIHQVGVKKAFQGQGIARYLMRYIMEMCVLWQGKYVVLQASQSGQPLYESLGFNSQFTIKNYQRV